MKPKQVIVNDRMQKHYVYELTQPMGKNFHPEFKPELTPREMLHLGVFGGKYMTDCRAEFPAGWFRGARLSSRRYDPKNQFLRGQGFATSFRVASKGVDTTGRSARLVS